MTRVGHALLIARIHGVPLAARVFPHATPAHGSPTGRRVARFVLVMHPTEARARARISHILDVGHT
jgi:hypothetical protein